MGRCKSWNLDSGLDYGLEYGLNSRLVFKLLFMAASQGLDLGPGTTQENPLVDPQGNHVLPNASKGCFRLHWPYPRTQESFACSVVDRERVAGCN